MQSNKQIVNSARRTYNQLGLNDRIITNTKLHTLRSILYRAGCNHSEVRVIMKWRRDAQSRLHPETCKRKQKELENEVRMLETEKRELYLDSSQICVCCCCCCCCFCLSVYILTKLYGLILVT